MNIPPQIAPVFSLDNASRKQQLAQKKAAASAKFRTHDTDTGSPQVQSKSKRLYFLVYLFSLYLTYSVSLSLLTVVAIMTERIASLAAHFAVHKKDQKGYRGFVGLVNNRKRMMRYLRQYDPQQSVLTVRSLGLEREAELLKSGKGYKHGQKYFKSI